MDLTSAVDRAARRLHEAGGGEEGFDDLPPMARFGLREAVTPLVAAVLDDSLDEPGESVFEGLLLALIRATNELGVMRARSITEEETWKH